MGGYHQDPILKNLKMKNNSSKNHLILSVFDVFLMVFDKSTAFRSFFTFMLYSFHTFRCNQLQTGPNHI